MSVLNIPTAEVFAPLVPPARDKGAFGGRGSGKSHFFAGLMIEDCLAAPGDSGEGLLGVCIREVQKDLAQSAKRLIEAKLAALGLCEADGFKVFRDAIRTPGDGVLIFSDTAAQDHAASDGCIILARPVRQAIIASGVTRLVVVHG